MSNVTEPRKTDGWKKMPSVTVGGKPHFWYHPGRREWIVWSREKSKWERR